MPRIGPGMDFEHKRRVAEAKLAAEEAEILKQKIALRDRAKTSGRSGTVKTRRAASKRGTILNSLDDTTTSILGR